MEKSAEVRRQADDHVFVKPAEPKIVEPKECVSVDAVQNKDKLVSIPLLDLKPDIGNVSSEKLVKPCTLKISGR